MSAGVCCVCPGTLRVKKQKWEVIGYRFNRSAFRGYRYTSSDYSLVQCSVCGRAWRTKAGYVETLDRQVV